MRNRRVSAGLLALVFPDEESAALAALPALMAVARAEAVDVRLACVRPIPAPRLGALDQVVAGTDQEMTRITRSLSETFSAAARRFDDVSTEVVVRFGRPHDEALIEIDVCTPALVSVCPGRGVARLSTWLVRRRLAQRRDIRLIVVETTRCPRWRHSLDVTTPQWRDVGI